MLTRSRTNASNKSCLVKVGKKLPPKKERLNKSLVVQKGISKPSNKNLKPKKGDVKLESIFSLDYTPIISSRDHEISRLETIFNQIHAGGHGNLVLVTGCPGSGKTLVVKNFISKYEKKMKILFLNCMSVPMNADMLKVLNDNLSKSCRKFNGISQLNEHIFKLQSTHKIIIILDEVDHMVQENNSALAPLLTMLLHSNLLFNLFLISNCLDFSTKISKLVSPRFKKNVHHIPFSPYNAVQIDSILKTRAEPFIKLFEKDALTFCSKKSSTIGGDARKALSIMRIALEKAISRHKNNNTDLEPHPMVRINDVVSAFKPLNSSKMTGPNLNAKSRIVLPTNQWLVFTSILQSLKDNNAWKFTINLNDSYLKYQEVCKKFGFESMEINEFLSVLSVLETYSFIKLNQMKSGKIVNVEPITSLVESVSILKNNPAMCSLSQDLLENLK